MCSLVDNTSPKVTEKHKHLKVTTSLNVRLRIDPNWETDLHSVPGSTAS